MKSEDIMINIWTIPNERSPSTVHLMGAGKKPLRCLNINIVAAEFGDTSRQMNYHQLVHLASLWTLIWAEEVNRRGGG